MENIPYLDETGEVENLITIMPMNEEIKQKLIEKGLSEDELKDVKHIVLYE